MTTFRKADFQDCGAVYRLICALEETTLPYAHFSSIFQSQTADPRYYCMVCELEGRIVGVLNLRFEAQLHHAQTVGEILEFFIDAPCRGMGIGRELLARACRISRAFGCAQIEVACHRARERAHRFYLREGMYKSHFKFSKYLTDQTPEHHPEK